MEKNINAFHSVSTYQFISFYIHYYNMFISKSIVSAVAVVVSAVIGAHAESHTVHFDNRCGYGTVSIPIYYLA